MTEPAFTPERRTVLALAEGGHLAQRNSVLFTVDQLAKLAQPLNDDKDAFERAAADLVQAEALVTSFADYFTVDRTELLRMTVLSPTRSGLALLAAWNIGWVALS